MIPATHSSGFVVNVQQSGEIKTAGGNPAVAIARVHERVKKGGHNVPVADIRRRFVRSLKHFTHNYAQLADRWAVWDSRQMPPRLIFESDTCETDRLKVILNQP